MIGSRGVTEECYKHLSAEIPANCTEIVTGGADGVDTLAARYAQESGIALKLFLPEYDKYGKNAALIRNDEIIAYVNAVLAFWDGYSRGTAYVINKCIETGVPVKVIVLNKNRSGETNESTQWQDIGQ